MRLQDASVTVFLPCTLYPQVPRVVGTHPNKAADIAQSVTNEACRARQVQ